MPTFRTPFTTVVGTGACTRVDGTAAGVTLFIATVALADPAATGPTTLYVGAAGSGVRHAVATVDPDRPCAAVRLVLPVPFKSAAAWELTAVGASPLAVSGEQHTRMTREQVDAVGSAAVAAAARRPSA